MELFDRGRATSLHLFEHVHGDSRDRGPAMIDLAQTYEKAGLYLAAGELPDYLPAVLEFVSTQPPREARAFLGEMAHILNVIFAALQQRDSAYASVLGALLELAGETAQAVKPVADKPLDASWAEPVVFDGCSSRARPGRARRSPSSSSARAHPAQEARMNALNNFLFNVYPYICLSGVPDGQPGPLRPRPVHLEERLVAVAEGRPAALGQQPVPCRHPVPVLRPLRRPADAAFRLRPSSVPPKAADGHGHRRHGRAALLRRADHVAAPALFDPRILHLTHHDIAILVILWVQLASG